MFVVVGGIFREVLDGDTNPRRRIGGSGLVAAIIAARLGVTAALVSFIGEEDVATATAMLDAAKVDASHLLTLPGASGTFVFATEGSRPWPMYRPAEATPAQRPSIPPAVVYIVFGMPDLDPIAEGWLEQLPGDSTLLWDRQGWLSRTRDHAGVAQLAPVRKVYLANEDEAITDFPAGSTHELTSGLPPAGFQWAVIKRGPDGCVVAERTAIGNHMSSAVGFPVVTSNTIGSGDAFAGGLAAGIIGGELPPMAVGVANAVASAFLKLGGDPLAVELPECTRSLVETAC
jgi:sugar/nucleoside kinase (ribokinase family)